MAYTPRKRARRIYPRVSTKPQIKEKKVGEFAAYKVGMTQVRMIDDKKGSPTFNQEIVVPVTILEAPPLKVAAIRAYETTEGGMQPAIEVWSPAEKIDRELARKVCIGKKEKKVDALEKQLDKISDLRLVVHTTPKSTGLGKKTPELFEVAIGGASLKEKLELAKEKLGGDVSVGDVFKEGQLVDISAVTKGKGFQGSITRWGIKRPQHKAQKVRRKAATLGPWHPAKVRPTTPQMGQMGFHTRTEYNKRILKIGKSDEIGNPAGWKNYGAIKSNFVLIKGSVAGHTRRAILLRQAIRPYQAEKPPQVSEILRRQF